MVNNYSSETMKSKDGEWNDHPLLKEILSNKILAKIK